MTEPSQTKKARLSYIPSLDGIRGLFCILIIINHWKLRYPISPIGWEVLQTFYVMSGFLITRILVNDLGKFDRFRGLLGNFYLKRTLRIFPLYFIYLIFWGLMRLAFQNSGFIQHYTQELADHWILYFTYTSNLKALFDVNAQDTPFFAHLWSLGLEEQFYIIMPFLIFFFRGKWLKIGVVAIILLPFLTRTVGEHLLTQYHDSPIWAGILIYRNLPFQMDAFAFGAALAVFKLDWLKHPKRWLAVLFTIFAALTVYHYTLVNGYLPILADYIMAVYGNQLPTMQITPYLFGKVLGTPELLPMGKQYIYMMPLVNAMVFLLLLTCIRGEPLFKSVFENKWMVEIGKLTYGMYVFHYAVIIIFLKGVSSVLGMPIKAIPLLWHLPLFLVYLGILIGLSRLSFQYIEMPFLKLKNRVR